MIVGSKSFLIRWESGWWLFDVEKFGWQQPNKVGIGKVGVGISLSE